MSDDVLLRLSAPKSVRRFTLPVRMDDGSLRLFTGWRLVYSNCFGPHERRRALSPCHQRGPT
jgi:glutamate dehydrogenase (NADP+)